MTDNKQNISDELISSFLDGNTNAADTMRVLDAAAHDVELREYIDFAQELDGCTAEQYGVLPMMCVAAADGTDNECSAKCELYLMRKFGIQATLEELLASSREKQWMEDSGTALFNLGRLLENKGLSVHRKYNAEIQDIKSALDEGLEVMAVVDGGEILGDEEMEVLEDDIVGEIPDHAVVVMMIDGDEVMLYDPANGEVPVSVNVSKFLDAWHDSRNYMLTVTTREQRAAHYKPAPIELDDVDIDEDLLTLREAIAENAHEVWAKGRMAEGWRYGEARDDAKKLHPDLLPYSDLPESEKEYDRETAMKTIMLLKKLGYEIKK